ncbi:MAG TPA: mandelate racemase/muconate lactonizing enzyme family protein [Bryobacteraceae bacterium]|nr:mandelate racemase/muconate lactonizing enzyme family protein [Bryobacteraceae bacterium]
MNRRELIGALGGGTAAVSISAPAMAQARRIAVDRLEVFDVPVNRLGSWLLLRLHTDAGITGIGEASQSGNPALTLALLHKLVGLIKGRGIFDIEWLKQQAQPEIAQQGRPAAVALSSLEQCLWDIRGKAFGVPVYALLGGPLQQRIRNYANINRSTPHRDPQGFAQMARQAIAAGFDAVKLAPFDDMPDAGAGAERLEEFTKLGVERAAAVRQAIGPKADLLIDAHSHFNRERGLDVTSRLEPLRLFWLEEVTPAKPLEDLAAIRRAAKMPTAGGELIYGAKGFYPYIAAGAVDTIMPDIKYCGGVLEMKKIAALAEGAGLKVAPHGPASPLGNAIAAQVCATLPNFHILELSYGEVPWRSEVIDPPEELDHGHLSVSDRPGFGCTLNEKLLSARGKPL